jgi:hypothetical protein
LLIVPIIPNYPGYDFFYYDHARKTTYFIQVTVEENAMDHVLRNDESEDLKTALQSWLTMFLPADTDMVDVWMILATEKFRTDYRSRKACLNVIYLHEMPIPQLKLLANPDSLSLFEKGRR